MKISFSSKFIYLTIVIGVLSFTKGYAQSAYNVVGVYADNMPIENNAVFLLNEGGSFYVTNNLGEKELSLTGTWSLQCLNKKNEYAVERTTTNLNEFNLIIDNFQFKNDTLAVTAFEGDSSNYFQAKIVFDGQNQLGSAINVEFPILLNLLPSTPEITVLKAKLEKTGLENEKAILELNITSERTDDYDVVTKIKIGKRVYTIYQPISIDEAKDFHTSATFKDEVFIIVYAYNGFGFIRSNELAFSEQLTSIEGDNTLNAILLYPNPVKDVIHIQGDFHAIKSINCLSLSGKTIKQFAKLENSYINVSALPSGIYIFEIEYLNQEKKESVKIIKN